MSIKKFKKELYETFMSIKYKLTHKHLIRANKELYFRESNLVNAILLNPTISILLQFN